MHLIASHVSVAEQRYVCLSVCLCRVVLIAEHTVLSGSASHTASGSVWNVPANIVASESTWGKSKDQTTVVCLLCWSGTRLVNKKEIIEYTSVSYVDLVQESMCVNELPADSHQRSFDWNSDTNWFTIMPLSTSESKRNVFWVRFTTLVL